ncbi:MAG: DoxX family membrane protein [Desulfobacterales bacterium]|nr:DoxX family membrane protein [Desulfobacterales bacterium]
MASLLVRTGLGIVFLWASWDKIWHPDAFASIIGNYQILPIAAVNSAAIVLPWVEFICGVFLVSGRLVPGAALTVDLLLLIFILVAGFNLYRGLDVNCGCFSVSPDAGGEATLNLIRNSLLLAAGIWLYIYTAGRPDPNHLQPSGGVMHNAG